MIENYFGGLVPEPICRCQAFKGKCDSYNTARQNVIMTSFGFSESLQEFGSLDCRRVDFMLVAEKPWKLAADRQQRQALGAVLYVAAETLRIVAVLAHPVIPDATQKIWEQLGQSGKIEKVRIKDLQWGGIEAWNANWKARRRISARRQKRNTGEDRNYGKRNSQSGQCAACTPSADSAPTAPIIAAVTGATAAPAASAKIGIEDFAKVELRAGIVKSAERIQGADKLLKLLVDIGDEVRQVLAGIALSLRAGRPGRPQSRDRHKPGPQKNARPRIQRHAASRVRRPGWQAGPLHLRRRRSGGRESKVSEAVVGS